MEYFEEIHVSECIHKDTYNQNGIPKDTDSYGNVFNQFNNPKIEFAHQDTILSSNM